MTGRDRDLVLLVLAAYAEASSEGPIGIRAQIHSVLNRHRARDEKGRRRWYSGRTVAETLLKPYAYSALNSSDHNRCRAAAVSVEDPVWLLCEVEARSALLGQSIDPTGGATHYYLEGSPEPDWVQGIDRKTGKRVAPPAQYTVQIGRHLFYKNVQ